MEAIENWVTKRKEISEEMIKHHQQNDNNDMYWKQLGERDAYNNVLKLIEELKHKP